MNTVEMTRRIAQARAETVRLLDKALSYSTDLQKPTQIAYYRAHIDYLDGKTATAPKSDPTTWNTVRAVLDAETQKEHALRIISAPTGTYDAATVEAARTICLQHVC